MSDEGRQSTLHLTQMASGPDGPSVWLDKIRITNGVAVKWPAIAIVALLFMAGVIFGRSATTDWMSAPGLASMQQVGVPGRHHLAITLAVPTEAMRCFTIGREVDIDPVGTASGMFVMHVEGVAHAQANPAAGQSMGVNFNAKTSAVDLSGDIEGAAAKALLGQAMEAGETKRLRIRIGVSRTAPELLWPGLAGWMPAQQCDLSL